ncbi:multidrug efflux RND transporter permease subunit [Labrys sp. ZIDIC5]|uniref:efflux RND transporter permease subunit n=1 Tax=Labrys sedimenti TaxID=3106036 RepID=UPI002ACA28B6|nr:multidrug efflux RND transporter permease subunit [Labrys sp. ZIDIC5]MDZ5452720.1 multidrug efflux RND transporter permease subunit [Labrys sp. ZIDIC5]
MKFGHFFVDRPIFAAVVSIVTVVIGLVSYVGLPIAQFPQIAPPTVVINATYPGANAQTIAETVAAPLEQSINGVEGMIYQTSQATNDGSLQITVTFATGTDLDIAQVQVQNRVSSAEPRLPAEVRALGITVNKSSSDFLLIVTLYSPDNSLNDYGISDYAILNVNDILARVDGVGSTFAFGLREPSLRVWLDPNRLASFDLTAGEVVQALREQNVQVSGGTLGAQPSPNNTTSEITVTTQGRFQDAEQFRNVIIKSTPDGRLLKLRDVARVEVGAKQYSSNLYLDSQPTVGIAVLQRPGSNALATADRVKAKMDDLAKAFPPGLKYSIVYNPTEFVSASIEAVYETFFEAIVLVVIVVFVFLQSWRAAIIPIIAIPVSIIGTFAVMAGLGFSLNMLTLFGLILAVGIVVDDAIVVVENVERNIHDGMTPNRAAHVTMDEVGRAVIAIALVLCAVFVPTAFIPGISGLFYQQFAVTIAAATVISAFNSLTLSPALAALLLKPHDPEHRSRFFLFRWLRAAGDGFNRGFDRMSRGYGGSVGFAARHKLLFLAIYGGLLYATFYVYTKVPTGFVPESDQGYAIVVVQLPDGASLERTDAVVRKAQQIAAGSPGVAHVIGVAGFSGATFTAASNAATIFVPFKPFDERLKEGLSAQAIVGELQKRVFAIEEGFVFVIPPPTIQGLGTGAGFKMQVQDRGGVGPEALMQAANALIGKANQTPGLTQVYTTLSNNGPQLFVNVDRIKARMLNVPIGNIFEAMQVYVGSAYVNDFTRLGRAFQVNAQAEGRDRLNKEDLVRLKVRSSTGALVPLGSLISFEERTGPDTVMRHNLYPAAYVSGSGLPGVSSTTALDLMEKAAAEVLPPGVGYEWTEIAFQERSVGNTIYFVFGIAVLFVFLFLAAQYESWSLPLAIILIVPLSILAALLGGMARGLPIFGGWWFKVMDNNIMTQISFVMLIGLAAKNAILIVEFARQREDHGDTPWQAVVEACRLRLRPILMTSFAFILGAVPLMIATGPGSELRQAIGTAVVFGMSGVTFLGLFLTPVFYVTIRLIVRKLFREKPKPSTVTAATMGEPEGS